MTSTIALGLSYLAYVIFWIATLILGVLDVIALRQTVERIYILGGFDRWGLAITSHTATVLLGLAWVILVFWAEGIYRSGVRDGTIWKRFATITLFQLLPLALLLWR